MTQRSNIERAFVRSFSPMARFRIARGMKQCELASRTRIHETIVSKIERGVRVATVAQVRDLASALRTTRQRMVALLFDSQIWSAGSRSGAVRRKSSRS